METPFLGKFRPKNQNYLFKLKFATYTNSNMQIWMMLFTFFVFKWKYPFWAIFGPKNQNDRFKLKFGTYTNSNMQSSIAMFTFLVFDQKCHFLQNLVLKVKIINLN